MDSGELRNVVNTFACSHVVGWELDREVQFLQMLPW
jgi:hypothetical protein